MAGKPLSVVRFVGGPVEAIWHPVILTGTGSMTEYTARELDEVLPLGDVYKATNTPKATAQRLRARGEYVPLIRLSPQRLGAFRRDVLAWLRSRREGEAA